MVSGGGLCNFFRMLLNHRTLVECWTVVALDANTKIILKRDENTIKGSSLRGESANLAFILKINYFSKLYVKSGKVMQSYLYQNQS